MSLERSSSQYKFIIYLHTSISSRSCYMSAFCKNKSNIINCSIWHKSLTSDDCIKPGSSQTLVGSLRPSKWNEITRVTEDLHWLQVGRILSIISNSIRFSCVGNRIKSWYATWDELNCSLGITDCTDWVSIDYSLNSDTWLM